MTRIYEVPAAQCNRSRHGDECPDGPKCEGCIGGCERLDLSRRKLKPFAMTPAQREVMDRLVRSTKPVKVGRPVSGWRRLSFDRRMAARGE